MAYRVEVKPSAAKTLRRLDKPVQKRIAAKIEALAHDPRPPGCESIAGEPGLLRIRSGDYRIIYTANDKELLVLVIRIGHRGEVYRKLLRTKA